MIRPNNYFDQIYLINLPRRPDKLTRVLWGLDREGIRVRVISAVDGAHPQMYGVQNKIPAGAYAYYLTWQQVLKDVQKMGYKRVLLLDDDVILHRNFSQLFDQWVSQRKTDCPNWRILLLGATQHVQIQIPIHSSGGSNGDNSGDGNSDNSDHNFLGKKMSAYHPFKTDGSFAVALQGQQVVEDLLRMIDPHMPKYVDSDLLRDLYRRPDYAGLCWVALPNLMIAAVGPGQSDIRPGRDQAELAAKVGWGDLSQYHYPLERPLVSVVVPCYNSERTINRCLRSLMAQTYRPLEVIVVDDGSADRSFQVVADILYRWQFQNGVRDLQYKLIRHGKNQGCYAARNSGIRAATGELIGFQDADDISLDYRIEDQVNALLQHDVLISTCNILRTHLHYLPTDPIELGEAIQRTRIHPNKYCCRSHVGLVTTLFRRKVFQKWGTYPNRHKWGEDDLYLRKIFPEVDAHNQDQTIQDQAIQNQSIQNQAIQDQANNNSKKKIRMMNYLNDHQYIPGRHYRVDEILYLSHEMTAQNLTIQRQKAKQTN